MLLQICLERREAYRRAWRELGGGVGRSEWDFKRAAWDGIVKSPTAGDGITDKSQVVTPSTSSGTTKVSTPAQTVSPSASENSHAATLLGDEATRDGVPKQQVDEAVLVGQTVST
jgi:hypothetical protein